MDSVLHRLEARATRDPDGIAQRYKEAGVWKPVSNAELRDRITYFARFLKKMGFSKENVVGIFAYNHPLWVVADLAPGLLGAKSAGIYPNSSPKEIEYILNFTRARVLIVQSEDYYKKLLGKDEGFSLPDTVESIVVIQGSTHFHPKAISFYEALDIGRLHEPEWTMKKFLGHMDVHEGVFIVFTSGTTGKPKGALISHDNLVFTTDCIVERFQLGGIQQGSTFSFLPLNHIAEKLQTLGVGLTFDIAINFCTSMDKLTEELCEIQPTLLLCVPRLWEKMHAGARSKIQQVTGPKRALLDWALAIGQKRARHRYHQGSFTIADHLQHALAEKLVLGKMKRAMGLGQVQFAASGAAPLPADVARWFAGLGVEILEDYGQSETTGVICLTAPGKDFAGTVGTPAPRTEFKLLDDGEICSKGRHVFKGYFKDEAATQAAMNDGWLITGDLGSKTPEGYIKIVGRKKEILKTSGGKMVAPLPIEEAIKTSPIIAQTCMVGDNHKYFVALVTLNEDRLKAATGASGGGPFDTLEDPNVLREVGEVISHVNKTLASYEQIKYFKVLKRDFSIEHGELTPTLKIKRNVIAKNFEHVIAGMYPTHDV